MDIYKVNNPLFYAALSFQEAGLVAIPINGNKEPTVKEWRQFQKRFPNEQELLEMFSPWYVKNIAILCGQISGGLEVIDLDLKYDLTGTLKNEFCTRIKHELPEIVNRLVIAQTRNDGLHFFYRTDQVARNQKLARRPSTDSEKAANPHDKVKVLIETRAEAGIVLVYPSKGYRMLRGDLASIPILTAQQRDTLINIARSFNQPAILKPTARHQPASPFSPDKPLDDFDQRGDIIALLEKHGWTVVDYKDNKTILKRPGQTDSRSSGNYDHKLGWFSVFSTSTDFDIETPYKPSAVYAKLECNDDFTLAAKRLLAEGYGVSYRDKKKVQFVAGEFNKYGIGNSKG